MKQHQILPALTALLSSSCCVIQLILNLFSISCAGFAVLTPYRPIFTCITIILLTYNVYKKGLNNRNVLFSVIISVALMISPNIVQIINISGNNNNVATTVVAQFYRIQLSGLGCEACANRIKNTLNTVEWIQQVKIFFHNQTAIIQTPSSTKDINLIVQLIKAIDTKYDAQVLDSWVGLHEINFIV